MNCDEFLKVLDETPQPGSWQGNGPAGWADHGSTCPECAFALRLERALRSAPRWAEMPRMAESARALVLAKAAGSWSAWKRMVTLAEDSAMTALAGAGIAAAVLVAAPRLWSEGVPESFRQAMSPYIKPAIETARVFSAPFGPFLHQEWGVSLLCLAGFLIFFAASLSAKSLSMKGVA